MSKKIKTDFFSHDREKSKQPNIYYIRKKFGNIYYAYYWLLIEQIYYLEDYQIDLNSEDTLFLISEELQVDIQKLKEILNIFVERKIFIQNENYIRSIDVDLQIKEIKEVSERNRKNKLTKKEKPNKVIEKQEITNNETFISNDKDNKDNKNNNNKDKETSNKQSAYYCNPQYRKERDDLEDVIVKVFEIMPTFNGLNNMQKSALKNLFEMINNGLLKESAIQYIPFKQWLSDLARESLQKTNNKSFMLSDFNNYLVKIIEQNIEGINQERNTNYKKEDLVYIHSSHDGFFKKYHQKLENGDFDDEIPAF